MVKAHSEHAFEDAIEAHLLEHGWFGAPANGYDRKFGMYPDELFLFIKATQATEWERYCGVKGGDAPARIKFMERLGNEISRRGLVDVFRGGVKDTGVVFKLAFFAPAHELTPELRGLYDANRLCVVRQAHVSESNTSDSVDLLLLLNGLPVATAEVKTQFTGQNTQDAIEQYRVDRSPSDLIFRERSLVHFAFDQERVAMATKLAGKSTRFLPFNLGSSGAGQDGGKGNPVSVDGPATAYLWEHVWQRDNWLNLVGSFIHVSEDRDKAGKKTGETNTIFPRYHQWDAVTKLLAVTKAEGPGFNKLTQHSAGSGKSNTIAWLALGLSQLHSPADSALITPHMRGLGLTANEPIFDKIIVVTDRRVLDKQLRETITSFDHTAGVIEVIKDNSQQLREALEGKKARVIVTTLQKFPVVAQASTDIAGTRFAVIVDEAHSSQSGEAVKDLKAVLSGKTGNEALEAAAAADAETEENEQDTLDFLKASMQARGKKENITFFAFTATPKQKTLALFGEKIIRVTGEEVFAPFHLYSMKQAIEEEFILDVLENYTTYKTYYKLANKLVGKDPTLPKGKAAAALAKYVSLHPTNLAQKAEIIVEHFREKTEKRIGGKAKAMVVTRSRLHAVKYFHAINAYIAENGYDKGEGALHTLVAFSGTVTEPDTPTITYSETILNGFPETELPEKFDGDYQVLVVAEKYQTGFDQPLLHTMYVDKKLSGVKAVQTLSRLNRMADGKIDTFVLDFENTGEEIAAAFAPFYQRTTASPTDANMLYNLQDRIMKSGIVHKDEIKAAVMGIKQGGGKGHKQLNGATNPAKKRWEDLESTEEKELFRTAVRDYVRTYAFLAQIVDYNDTDMESLYYYSKFLITRIEPELGERVNVDDSVILTHLRTDIIKEEANLGIKGTTDPLAGAGDGGGKTHNQPEESLSKLINTINDRFGMNLTEVDRIYFQQLKEHFKHDEAARLVATTNDPTQFRVWIEGNIEKGIVERNNSNGELFNTYFTNPEFKQLMNNWIAEVLYAELRSETNNPQEQPT